MERNQRNKNEEIIEKNENKKKLKEFIYQKQRNKKMNHKKTN